MATVTPMMQNYLDTKEKYKDCILFYRLGDFYEMFFDDAITVSKELELTLTGKDCGLEERAPMCGIPHHAINTYIPKLIEKGYKVAICEQLEDPRYAKGIVKRDVVKIVTPGTITDLTMLDEKKNNYIACIYMERKECAISFCDISTGEFFISSVKGVDVNTKISYTDKETNETNNYIIKKISGSFMDATMTIEMIRFYENYPNII